MRELSLNLLDISQNSITANATLIEFEININSKDDLLVIRVDDNGHGMSDELLKSVINPFYTTRNTRQVGLGIPLFKMAAEMTGGKLDINSQVNKGTHLKATFGYSHIDRMPLGDICGTITSLIRMNPDIDFVYRENVDGQEFLMDTREMRKILVDVPLNQPEVVEFIAGYFKENSHI